VTFTQTLMTSLREMFPGVLIFPLLPLIPFIIAEQIWPVDKAPRFRDYGMNVLIGISTRYLSLPLGIAAGLWSAQLRHVLPWQPFSFTFHSIASVPTVHHSDELMNASTWERDHFLQNSWRTFLSIFTLGLIVDLDLTEAGKAALYSNIFLMALSMFYHSAIRVQIPWLNRILVTPQVHRIHHGVDSAYHNKNFADALPIFDILFGTYHHPGRGEFPRTGLGQEFPAPNSLWSVQFGPLAAITRMLLRQRRARVKTPSRA
jgi:sterol desaturase/sphingolipid hydroxylase (fatty acid hydroxylase superfamily)